MLDSKTGKNRIQESWENLGIAGETVRLSD